ncbi:hypothetical protein GCM10009696_14600 [Kocuria himachalensis]
MPVGAQGADALGVPGADDDVHSRLGRPRQEMGQRHTPGDAGGAEKAHDGPGTVLGFHPATLGERPGRRPGTGASRAPESLRHRIVPGGAQVQGLPWRTGVRVLGPCPLIHIRRSAPPGL